MRPSVYLDNAATTFPKPPEVYAAIDRFMRECGGSPGRGLYAKAVEAEEMISETRQLLAKLLGAPDASRIVLTANSTEALNLALKGYLRAGDHVVTTVLEHNAVLRPLHVLTQARGVTVSYVDCDPLGRVNPEDVARALRKETRLVACVHGSNVLGAVLDIAAVARVAHDAGIPVLVDGSQTAGTYPVDLAALGVDMFAFTGHKGLLGAPGTGGLYVAPNIDLETFKEGGTGSASESLDPPSFLPDRFEPGTPNTYGIAGLRAGVSWVLERGVERIRAHETALANQLHERLSALRGVRVLSPGAADARLGIVSFVLEHISPTEACAILSGKLGIMTRCGLHCAPLLHRRLGIEDKGSLRLSPGPFNTEEDIDLAAKAVETMIRVLYRR
ncbi:MAG: aminotransferase class V-fold PLP-dependent enzyme [Deltaproteobacteria bacterium]|nr:aminotransferase class V-fold PLP-dependent enzyme [Deltaproteobacteria bacterium]